MLLEFSVEGFTSIGELQTLTFNAFHGQRIRGTKYQDNYIESTNREAKSAVLFGGNAVGKTNLLVALDLLLDILKTGNLLTHKRYFNHNYKHIKFSISLSSDKHQELTYDLVQTIDGQVQFESLLADESPVYEYSKGVLSSPCLDEKVLEIYSIPSTSTLLSKIKDFMPDVYLELKKEIDNITVLLDDFINPDVKPVAFVLPESSKKIIEENKQLALNILSRVDVTIQDIKFVQLATTTEEGEVEYDLVLVRYVNGEAIDFPSAYESKGIKRIVRLLGYLIYVCEGRTLIVDELDASISTRSLLLLYNNIINSTLNQKGQLIVTSHNLGLFDIDIFAPEQIYIANKSQNLETRVHSLADFDIRKDKKRLVIDYLQGQFEVLAP